MANHKSFSPNPEVAIHPFTVDWVPELFQLIDRNRPHLNKLGNKTSSNYPDVQSLFDSVAKPSRPHRERFIITHQDEVAGSVNITPDIINGEPVPQEPIPHELGYYVSGEERFSRKGIASSAAHLVVQQYIDLPTVSEIFAYTHPQNYPSQGVLKKIGFSEADPFFRFVYRG